MPAGGDPGPRPLHPCPSCGGAVAVAASGRKRHWVCGGCGGRAILDWRLGPPLPPVFVERVRAALDAGGLRGVRRCPFCAVHMVRLRAPLREGILALDGCDHCRLLWFDGGEHEAAAGLRPPPPPSEVDGLRPSALSYAPPAGMDIPVDASDRLLENGVRDLPAFLLGVPLEQGVRPPLRYPATWALAGAAAAASILGMLPGFENLLRDHGLDAARPLRHGGLDWITSFLLHDGPWHLLGNLWFLAVFGDDVEDEIGPGPFLLLVAASAAAGNLLFLASAAGEHVVTVGASGGISGVVAFYGCAFPRRRLRILRLVYFSPIALDFTARVGLAAWLAFQVVAATSGWAAVTGVNHLAHLGGAAVGIAAWWWVRR